MALTNGKDPHEVGTKTDKQNQMKKDLDRMAEGNKEKLKVIHPVPIKEKMNKHVQITMSDSIYEAALEKASAMGMNLSQYIRYLILDNN